MLPEIDDELPQYITSFQSIQCAIQLHHLKDLDSALNQATGGKGKSFFDIPYQSGLGRSYSQVFEQDWS